MEKRECDFERRHIGPSGAEQQEMLAALGYDEMADFLADVLPAQIRLKDEFGLSCFDAPLSEKEALTKILALAKENKLFRSYIGMGYYGTVTPPVIQRNILENPGWYTQYTPYQPEISQGRLEALFNFQSMIVDLTGLPVANASLLDEGTAAAEAMSLSLAATNKGKTISRDRFLVDADCFPQTIAVVQTRAEALGVKVEVAPCSDFAYGEDLIGALLAYPGSSGELRDQSEVLAALHEVGGLAVLSADIMSLVLLKSPGELGADIAVGSTQRFGVPLGFGGPHAAFFAVKEELRRLVPGRVVGLSKDSAGRAALRLALQTREQHIRREKATSNICTAQVLLAIMAGMYAVYHGPEGLRAIARRINYRARCLSAAIKKSGLRLVAESFFDTVGFYVDEAGAAKILMLAKEREINLGHDGKKFWVALDESVSDSDFADLVEVITGGKYELEQLRSLAAQTSMPTPLLRKDAILQAEVFNRYQSETELLRYIKRLESRDLSLCTAMIPLGSCTMKLNATAEMYPISWSLFSGLHPFVPKEQTEGYRELFDNIEKGLAEATGFAGVSLQPNAGSQGEYAGLMVIRGYHQSRGDNTRRICLIPSSAHGTNPASAVMAGFEVVGVRCDERGNIDLRDLEEKAASAGANLAALMVTYPSTHGVFEEEIKAITAIVHRFGGQVYLDGANFNALLGLSRPAELGADVMHFNLHKTFAIPHGGGGPGVGPIAVAAHLVNFLPDHPVVPLGREGSIGTISAAPWGSAGVLPIPWMYLAMMGASGLRRASEVAILNANYIAKRLEGHYPLLFSGTKGLVAHECVLDCRSFKRSAGIEVEDIAKRLIDYGFHAPTVSWPVAGTLMVEPTESESKWELDRFCEAMIAIGAEIAQIESGEVDSSDNCLKNAPHTAEDLAVDNWPHPYSREKAAYPTPWSREYKFWPAVSRIDSAYGDRNFVCSCWG